MSVLIDFKNQHLSLKQNVLKYYDLSVSGNSEEAAHNLFKILREAELVENAKYILISNISDKDKMIDALFDRMFRASSGKFAYT